MIITNLVKETPGDHQLVEFARDIENGLSSFPKKISSKYFYDDLGSQLFQQITKLDEYYVTKTELSILENIKNILPDLVGVDVVDIVELGVGDGHKTKLILESFYEKNIKVHFYPIDISPEAFHLLENNINENRNLTINAIVGDYLEGLNYVRENSKNRQIVLFLGSNIGNFSKEESLIMLKKIRAVLSSGDFLLIGFDLKKDTEVLIHAYNDGAGVTAQFNLNLLLRINNQLGANFDLNQFKHFASYNPNLGAMESYLISLIDQDVTISSLNKTFHFQAFEPIHLEYSFKYQEEDIHELSKLGGFNQITNFADDKHYYIDSLWQVN